MDCRDLGDRLEVSNVLCLRPTVELAQPVAIEATAANTKRHRAWSI
jgi:hypothetical protein